MKKMIYTGMTVLGMIALSGCGTGNADINTAEHEAKAHDLAELERMAIPEESTEEPSSISTVESEDTADNSFMEQEVLNIMNREMGSYVSAEFDAENKVYKLTPIDPDFIGGTRLIPEGMFTEEWNAVADSITELSLANMDTIGSGYHIQLMNPDNPDNFLLWVIDGIVMYNVVDDY